ncbi:MAG: diacylglycerol kinase family lipid kinase [Verrucomicrobia bacterium]|nr:diacylglycerol kinase family lipid kinase [Verrucomicrobiota bacterium]MDE3098410.1 diacylglycerol kinase family lipid kinase [Verrucomicrobiota bacterium]
MRICVIFNPSARGNKARHFRDYLDNIAGQSALKATAVVGDARRFAAEAIGEGFDVIVGAGGDGTINDAINGIADVPGALGRVRFGILPLGTVNVYARELKIPQGVEAAWATVQRGNERRVDLPHVTFSADGVHGGQKKVHFAQLAGAGMDARAIELLNPALKIKIGPLAYVVAGFKAIGERKPALKVSANGRALSGEWVLVGNGKFYGGPFRIFPDADLADGLLDVCVFPKADFSTLLRCGPAFALRRQLAGRAVRRLQAARFEVTADGPAAFELDGEWMGRLPAVFSMGEERLRVLVP